MTIDIEAIKAAAEKATPGMVWFAHMDELKLKAHPPGSSFINDEITLALCATGEHACRVVSYLAEVQPSAVLEIIARIEAAERLGKSSDGLAEATGKLISATEAREAELIAQNAALREALAWYGENARLCRLIHSEGDKGRNALSDDGGTRAQTLLTTPAEGVKADD